MDYQEYEGKNKVTGLLKDGEKVLFSSKVVKLNKKNEPQRRKIIITNLALYSIRKGAFFRWVASVTAPATLIKRRIALPDIEGIVYSRVTDEFVVYVPTQFDYRFKDECKDKMISFLLQGREACGQPTQKFFVSRELQLEEFCTHRSWKKAGKYMEPIGEEFLWNSEIFKGWLSENKTHQYDETKNILDGDLGINDPKKQITFNDFDMLKRLGNGAFGEVWLGVHKETQDAFALKIMRKEQIIKDSLYDQVLREKAVLNTVKHPFCVGLKCAFQTDGKLVQGMPFVEGRDLKDALQKSKFVLPESEVRFIVAQLILALSYLHQKGIVYQDLKPANVFMCPDGYLKLGDFGATTYFYQNKTAKSYLGTLQYVAPEVFFQKAYTKMVDWWALGVMMYQMLYGELPFSGENWITDPLPKDGSERRTIQDSAIKNSIMKDALNLPPPPKTEISEECKDFMVRLLKKIPMERIGFTTEDELQDHPWFGKVGKLDPIDEESLLAKKIIPPKIYPSEPQPDMRQDKKRSPRITLLSDKKIEYFRSYLHKFSGFNAGLETDDSLYCGERQGEEDEPEDDDDVPMDDEAENEATANFGKKE